MKTPINHFKPKMKVIIDDTKQEREIAGYQKEFGFGLMGDIQEEYFAVPVLLDGEESFIDVCGVTHIRKKC